MRKEISQDLRGAQDGVAGERALSYKGVVINGNENLKSGEETARDYVGKGKTKMYEEDRAQWIKVEGRESRKLNGGRYSLRRGERENRQYQAWFEGATQGHEGQFRQSGNRGLRRERSPRDQYQYQERTKTRVQESTRSIPSAQSSGTAKKNATDAGQVILAPVKDLVPSLIGKEEEAMEDGIDVVNETLLAQENGVIGEAMDTEEAVAIAAGDTEDKEENLELQNLTGDDLEEPEGELEVTKNATKENSVEEGLGEKVNEDMVEDEEKNRVPKKKPSKSVPLIGGTAKQRMMQMANKRPSGKTSSKQSVGEKHGQVPGTSNPKIPTPKS